MMRRLAPAVAAAWLVVGVELAVVLLLDRERIASVWELQYGGLWLAPVSLAVTALLGALGACLLAVADRARRRPERIALTAASAALAGAVAWGVATGRHFAGSGARIGFALAAAAVAAAAAYAIGPGLSRALARRPALVGIAVAFALPTVELVNRFVLVRRYPALHWGLAVVTLLVAPALWLAAPAAWAGSSGAAPRRGLAAVGAVVALALAAAVPASARLGRFDNFRLLLLEQAPLLGRAVEIAAWLSPRPPAPRLAGCADGVGPGCNPSTGTERWNLSGRDVVLVTIDALRADHVGAYGYSRRTTPNIDRMAAHGVVFENAYCATPHTSYSIASIMTGKYMRPLLLQGTAEDSDTFASLLEIYGYQTAAFYPPAVFFIDRERFRPFETTGFDFDYRKQEFLEGDARVLQIESYLTSTDPDRPLLLWVHLFGPHEPYEQHDGHAFGDRDLDRYDSEIAEADATVGKIVSAYRRHRRPALWMITADHGEEFGEHGGRYHGTTVYEEQARVPLVLSMPGLEPRRVRRPVQTIDLLPTVLAGLRIPRRPRIRGRDLGRLIVGEPTGGGGLAFAETDDDELLARGDLRLLCSRRLGACRLYDLARDPSQRRDASAENSEEFAEMRSELRRIEESHGTYEERGLRAEGRGWPGPVLRGMAGDGSAAPEIAALLDDAEVDVRRKAASILFDLRRPGTAAALRLALGRDEDPEVRRWCALALTRMGQGAPLANELVRSGDRRWRRLAALALAEAGDPRGEGTLVSWWKDPASRDFSRSKELLAAFGRIRSKQAVWPLTRSLDDVRLRPRVAATLAAIGEEVARVPLARALAAERQQTSRIALARALVDLGAGAELVKPLVRFLGVPDPLPGGLGLALEAGIIDRIGGPARGQLGRLRANSSLGDAVTLIVPRGGNGNGVRMIVRARSKSGDAGQVALGRRIDQFKYDRKGQPVKSRDLPRIDPEREVRVSVPAGETGWLEIHAPVPRQLGIRPGRGVHVVVFADAHIEIAALVLVPLSDEIPPPAPEPWTPEAADAGSEDGAPGPE